MPSFSLNLENTLHRALANASERKHVYATIEHLLLSLIDDPDAGEIMQACDIDLDVLRFAVTNYLDIELDSIKVGASPPIVPAKGKKGRLKSAEGRADALLGSDPRGTAVEPNPTSGFQRVVQRAIIHVQSSGKEEVTGANVLVSLFSERDSHAVGFLHQQDMTRLDAVSYISHGVGKGRAAQRSARSAEVVASVASAETVAAAAAPLPRSISRRLFNDLKPHRDNIAGAPSLGTPRIAESIVEFLSEIHLIEETSAVRDLHDPSMMAVGVYGPWGSGKSTLLRAVSQLLIADGAVVVNINTWKWDGEEDIYAFMNGQLLASLHRVKDYRWKVRSIRALLFIKKHNRKLVTLLTVAVAALILAKWVDWGRINPSQFGKGSVYAAVGAALVATLTKPLGTFFEKLILRKPTVELAGEALSTSYRYLLLTKGIGRSKSKPIYFVFDDLDRCDPDRVVKFVSSIHRVTMSGSVSILGCDDRIVGSAIYRQFKDVADLSGQGPEFGARFLEKIVHVHFRMPDISEADLTDLGLRGAVLADGPAGRASVDAIAVNSVAASASPGEASLETTLETTKESPHESQEVDQIRLSNICGEVLGAAVAMYSIPIRKAKFLSNLLKLYTMVFPPLNEEAAYRMAAFIVLLNLDRDLLNRINEGVEIDWQGAARKGATCDRFRQYLGSDSGAIASLYVLCGVGIDGTRVKSDNTT